MVNVLISENMVFCEENRGYSIFDLLEKKNDTLDTVLTSQ